MRPTPSGSATPARWQCAFGAGLLLATLSLLPLAACEPGDDSLGADAPELLDDEDGGDLVPYDDEEDASPALRVSDAGR